MIVEPDFLNHWKTQMLIDELKDRAAPLYVLALWAHCQQRRTASFDSLPPNALKAICRYEGEASKLRSALERCGFLDAKGAGFEVHGWADANRQLIANWTNGPKGGRPPKNPPKTHGFPVDNPNTDRGNPPVSDREEERRPEDRERENRGGSHRRPTIEQARTAGGTLGIVQSVVDEWWHAREASEWIKGTAGGGTTPVGSNWQADLKTYASRSAPLHRFSPTSPKPHRIGEFPEPKQPALPRL